MAMELAEEKPQRGSQTEPPFTHLETEWIRLVPGWRAVLELSEQWGSDLTHAIVREAIRRFIEDRAGELLPHLAGGSNGN